MLAANFSFGRSTLASHIDSALRDTPIVENMKLILGRSAMVTIIDESGYFPPKYRLGQTVITSNAASTLSPEDVANGLFRHTQRDIAKS